MNKGKFIVIDGIDGSGKATQADLLIERLRREGRTAAKADFPQYGHKSAGLVENYLNGAYGAAAEVSPYVASFFYMLDRYDASFGLRRELEQGNIVVSNRYVSANMGHQGGKFGTREARQRYFEWLDRYEYGVFDIPRPDLTIVLHVPPEVAQTLVDQKAARGYTSGASRDAHEADLNHLARASETYREMCALFPDFKLVECAPDGRMFSIEAVRELVWEQVTKII
ncbi:MAG: deoxynucleoside kinase [Parcubacteria group bacterium]|nr:deoxynucleoside kinase [Parcubacteria group bacterium]